MKTRNLIIAVAALFSAMASPAQVRLMSYNIRNGVGIDNVRDLDRTASVISRIAPDAVAVEEVDSVTGRSGGVYVLGMLAEKLGMHATYAPAIDFDGGRYGIGLLSRTRPLSVKRLPLPGREERRAMLVAEFPDYVYCVTHLSLTEADRDASLPVIMDAVKGFDKPVFIAGDFNSQPNDPFMVQLQKNFTVLNDVKAPTFPADSPIDTIDYIAELNREGAKGSKVSATEVVDAPVESDHRPILVTVTLPSKR